MPLYMCTKCGLVENTALGGFWRQQMEAVEAGKKHDPLCSACDPEIGAWHGSFPQRSAAGYVQTKGGHLYTIAESLDRAKHMGPFMPVVLPPEIAATTFHIRVDGGPEQVISVRTGVYRDAAAAVPALLGLDLPIDIEIWAPHLLPDYGPCFYRVRQNEFVGLVTEILVPR